MRGISTDPRFIHPENDSEIKLVLMPKFLSVFDIKCRESDVRIFRLKVKFFASLHGIKLKSSESFLEEHTYISFKCIPTKSSKKKPIS